MQRIECAGSEMSYRRRLVGIAATAAASDVLLAIRLS